MLICSFVLAQNETDSRNPPSDATAGNAVPFGVKNPPNMMEKEPSSTNEMPSSSSSQSQGESTAGESSAESSNQGQQPQGGPRAAPDGEDGDSAGENEKPQCYVSCTPSMGSSEEHVVPVVPGDVVVVPPDVHPALVDAPYPLFAGYTAPFYGGGPIGGPFGGPFGLRGPFGPGPFFGRWKRQTGARQQTKRVSVTRVTVQKGKSSSIPNGLVEMNGNMYFCKTVCG